MATQQLDEEAIFDIARRIESQQLRADYVQQACGSNTALMARVQALLAVHDKAPKFLEAPPSAVAGTVDMPSLTELPGTMVGPYKLLQQIGEGGFGVVYMAEQQRPVRRKVALKIIKPGMDSREVIARFESERQALALMDHPNIARVLDGGTTESGRPYFVMELVKGVPLTQFCDDNKLDMGQRLALFSAVCRAIQHAHHKGVIHRDIKPSNVMVTLHDGQPVPKVIDFGVSKAISQQLTEKTMFTAYGQMIGTPAYMSPEQAEMSGLDIDTRSDVYSLGVLLYELLTGGTPLDAQSLRGKAYAELQRMIREDEPPRPSLRVSTQGEATALIAARRGAGPRELGAILRGELDWIVMKALEKNRDRRYESPNDFAADVERYLRNETVEACPPSALYRARKTIRRHRVACTTGTLVALSLLGGIFVSALAARDALHQRRLAEESLHVAFADRQAAEQAQKNTIVALQAAERERDRAEKAQAEESKLLQIAKEREAEAKAARQEESAQRTAAEQERDKATALNAELAKQKEQQRRSLYVAQMNLIRKAWDSNNIPRVRALLNTARPQPGESDLRGFEWHYWVRMLHGGERVLQLPINLKAERASLGSFRPGPGGRLRKKGLIAAAFSNDGKYVATVTESSSWLVNVWETSSGKELFATEIRDEVAVRPSGQRESTTRGGRMVFSNIDIAHVDSQRIAVVLTTTPSSFAPTRFPGSLFPTRTADSGTARLHVFGTDTGEEKYSRDAEFLSIGNDPFAFSHDGSCFAAPLKEPFVQVCGTDSGAEIARVAIPTREGARRISEFLALSPDGKKLAIKPGALTAEGAVPFGITIHELGTNKQVETPSVRAQQLEFSADGLQVATFDRVPDDRGESRVKVFDATTGSETRQFVIPAAVDEIGIDSYRAQCFSPTGTWLAFSLNMPLGNAALQLWNSSTGKVGPRLQGHSASPVAIRFSEDGSRLFSIHEDGTLMIWPVPTSLPSPQTLTSTPPGTEQPEFRRSRTGESTSPNGRWSVQGPGPPTANPSATDPPENPPAVPAGELILKDQSGKVADRALKLAGRLFRSRFSPDNAFIAALGVNQEGELDTAAELKVWDVLTGRELIVIQASARELDFPRFGFPGRGSPPPGFPPSAPSPSATVNGQPILPNVVNRTLPNGAQAIAFSPDSRRLALPLLKAKGTSRQQELVIHVWELPTGRHLHSLAVQPTLTFSNNELKFSRGGDLLMGAPLGRGIGPIETISLFSPFSQRAPYTQREPGIRVWEVATGRLLWEDRGAALVLANADETRLAGLVSSKDSGSELSHAAVVWDIRTGEELLRVPLSSNRPPAGFVFSADGHRVAVASGSDVAVYDVKSGKELFLLQGHAGDVRAVAFSPDNSRIASAAGTIRIAQDAFTSREEQRETKVWDGATGQELLSLSGVTTGIVGRFFYGDAALQFSPHSLVARGGSTWDASPLPPSTEAEELVQWLAAPDDEGRLPTLDQIAERLKADTTITDEARSRALTLSRERRLPSSLREQAAVVLRISSLPREHYARALALTREANERSPSEPQHVYLESLAHHRLGDFAGALAAAKRAQEQIKTQQRSPLADDLTVLALAQQALGELDAALKTLDEARLCHSHNETAWQELLAEAEEKLAIPKSADNPDRWIGRRFMPRRAARMTDESGARVSDWSLPFVITRVAGDRLGFGKIFVARTDVVPLEDATRYYTSVLETSLRSEFSKASMLCDRGVAWRTMGEPDKAIADYTAAIQLDPRGAVYYSNRGAVYANEKEAFEKALADYDEAIRLQPNTPAFHLNRGASLRKQGRFDEALKSADEAIRMNPDLGYAYGARARTWSAKGDRANMLADLAEGIRRDPGDPRVWTRRALLLATSPNDEHRDGQQALADANKACELSAWKEPVHIDALAAAYAETSNFTEAIKWQEKALSLSIKQFHAEYEARLALYRAGKPYREQLKANPVTN